MISNHKMELLDRLDQAKSLIDQARPLPREVLERLRERLMLDWTYNSNALSGNSLDSDETRRVILDRDVIPGKSLDEHLAALNHLQAIELLEKLIQSRERISETSIRKLHGKLFYMINNPNAGRYRDTTVSLADYVHDYLESCQQHPVVQAAFAHFALLKLSPFKDGNGRVARLLMNLILMQSHYPPVIILKNDHEKYHAVLKAANAEKTEPFIQFIARSLERTLGIYMQMIPGISDELLSFAEAEKISPYSRHYLGVMARRGVIPAFKLKRNWVIYKKALQEYVARER